MYCLFTFSLLLSLKVLDTIPVFFISGELFSDLLLFGDLKGLLNLTSRPIFLCLNLTPLFTFLVSNKVDWECFTCYSISNLCDKTAEFSKSFDTPSSSSLPFIPPGPPCHLEICIVESVICKYFSQMVWFRWYLNKSTKNLGTSCQLLCS